MKRILTLPSLKRARVAIVIAAIEARASVARSLGRFLAEAGDDGEVILVDASRDDTADEIERLFANVRILRRAPGHLAPELWRDGLRVADAPLVAFSTAQMVPAAGWLSALRRRIEATGAAAVGGPIDPCSSLSPADAALYLHRYANYLRPLPEELDIEPPGDNALYRRESLMAVEPVWQEGFWEVAVHRALRERGQRLAMSEDASVEFEGGAPLADVLLHRRRHARHYGAARAGRMTAVERLARSAAAPLVPAVLLRRLTRALAARDRRLGSWVPAFPALARLLAVWTLGELEGIWLGPPASAGATLAERVHDQSEAGSAVAESIKNVA